ncbi:MAG: hypothetical protein LAT65_18075 [Saccharospirillum sp.]|nr:hypothetical protein [Saccharospirillum sp.]
MAMDVTGVSTSIRPISPQDRNNSEARTNQAPLAENRRPGNEPDIRVDTRLAADDVSERALVEEASGLSNAVQQRQDLANDLRSERQRLDDGNPPSENRQALEDATERALERGRSEPAEREPLFTNNPEQTRANLDTAINELEQRNSADQERLGELTQAFNTQRDQTLRPGSVAISSSDEAQQQVAQVTDRLRTETPQGITGLTQVERDTVLTALQS